MNKKKEVIHPKVAIPLAYAEGKDGYTEIAYNGDDTIRVKGKASGHLYLFEPGVMRVIDANDAQSLLERDDFYTTEVEDVKGDNSESRSELI